MRLPLFPVFLGLHFGQSRDGPFEREHFFLAGKHGRVQRLLVVDLDTQVVDQLSILNQLFLKNKTIRFKT